MNPKEIPSLIHVSRPRVHMKRYETPGDCRFLTFSCYQRLPLLRNPKLRTEFVHHLDRVRTSHKFRLIAFVVMPEHVHLFIRPSLPEYPVSRIMMRLKMPFAKSVLHRWSNMTPQPRVLEHLADGDRLRFWQRGGGYDRNIFRWKSLAEKIEYMHANPVRRELVERPNDWIWSSAIEFESPGSGLIRIDPVD